MAALGVLAMTFIYGQFPWISLYLATTWGFYGLLRKQSPLSSIEGLTLETAVLSIPAIVYHIYLISTGSVSFFIDLPTGFLLVGTGLISGLPLMIFITGARIINLSLIGILQYIYPTLIFVIGYFIYHEPLTEAKIIGFIFIWIAIFLYTLESGLFHRKNRIRLTKKSQI